MIQPRTPTHKNWSRWNGSDDDSNDGGSWDKKCEMTMPDGQQQQSEAKSQKEGLSMSCHTVGGGLSRIKSALSRSVHTTASKPSKASCRSLEITPTVDNIHGACVTPNAIVNFAEQQNFAYPVKNNRNEQTLMDRRARVNKRNSFRGKTNFDELDDETDESSDELPLVYPGIAPSKSSSLRVLPQNPRPTASRNCNSMNDLNVGRPSPARTQCKPPVAAAPAFGRRDSLPPRYGSRTTRPAPPIPEHISVETPVPAPVPVHIAAEKVANQKINFDRELRASTSAIPSNRPAKVEADKKQQRHSAPATAFSPSSFAQLEKAFGREDSLDHYFEMVKASPRRSPCGGPKSVFTYLPSNKLVSPVTTDARSVDCSPSQLASPSRHCSPKLRTPPNCSPIRPSTTQRRTPKVSPSPATSKRGPSSRNASSNNNKRPPMVALLSNDDDDEEDDPQVCAAQLEIPLAAAAASSSSSVPIEQLSQLQVQYNLYEQMKHSSTNLMGASFRTMEAEAWDLDQILTAKVK